MPDSAYRQPVRQESPSSRSFVPFEIDDSCRSSRDSIQGFFETHNNNNTNTNFTTHNLTIPKPRSKPPTQLEKTVTCILTMGLGSFDHGLTGKALLYFTTVFVSLGVFLFGYDQGVMSGIITSPYFLDYFNQPSRAEIGTMVAILEVGALASSLLVGRVGDIIGRRKTIMYGSLIFIIGGAIQSFTIGIKTMILGRTISGIGVGFLSTIVPVYQSEISPPHNRGKLACIEFTGNIVGYSSSVWVDYACSYIKSDASWRLPLFLQCVIGGLLFLGSFIIVETPRWLLDHDHDDEGMQVIANLHGGGDILHPASRQEFKEIKESVFLERMDGKRTYKQMWKKYKKRVLIAMSSQMFAQLNGINVISYYAPLVFEQAGWVGRQAILMTGINSIVYIMSTIPPWYLSDRWGRRFILLSGALIMAVSLSLISYFMYLSVSYTPTAVVILVIIYNAFFGYSWGPIPWLYPPEILPLSVRAKGASLSTASNWLFNFIVGEATPILQELITWRLYLIHAFSCMCSFICVYFLYPETMGVNLEDMGSLFGDKSIMSSTLPSSAMSHASMDSRSVLSQDILANRNNTTPNSPVLQPSAASIARGNGGTNSASRSRSNSIGGHSGLGPSYISSPGGPANQGSYAAALSHTPAARNSVSSPLIRSQGPSYDDDVGKYDDNEDDYDEDRDNYSNRNRQLKNNKNNSSSSAAAGSGGGAATVSGFFGKLFKKPQDDQDLESGSRPLLDNNNNERH